MVTCSRMSTPLPADTVWSVMRPLREDFAVVVLLNWMLGLVLDGSASAGGTVLMSGAASSMAYPDMCNALGFSCTRLLHWANPEKRFLSCDSRRFSCNLLQYWFYPGAPMRGPAETSTACATRNTSNTSCDADDSRALNNTALTVANFRQATK